MPEQYLVETQSRKNQIERRVSLFEELLLNKVVYICMNLKDVLGSKEALLEKMEYACHLFARAA